MKKKIAILAIGLSLSACASEHYYEHGKKVTLTKMDQKREVSKSNVDYYMTAKGHKVGVRNEIIVQCQNDVNCMDVLKGHTLDNITTLSKTLYLVKIKKESNVFKISEILHNDKNILFAHPNFSKKMKRR